MGVFRTAKGFPLKYLVLAVVAFFVWRFDIMGFSSVPKDPIFSQTTGRTAIFYAYHECGTMCMKNLQYFAKTGIWNKNNADYYIVVNGECSVCNDRKFQLPNVHVLYRDNKGFDNGAYAHALSLIDKSKYSYFLFMNGSVRGPLLTATQLRYIRFWHKSFTDMLSREVKLAGATISCEQQLHVQTHIFVVDTIGLELLSNAGFFANREATTRTDHLATEAVLNAGYNIDSRMIEYLGFDWRSFWIRKKGQGLCNDGLNPLRDGYYHGSYVDPFEVMFYKKTGNFRKKCVNGKCRFDRQLEQVCEYIEKYVDWLEN